MRHHGSNPLKYQDHRVELRALPLKPMECGFSGSGIIRSLDVHVPFHFFSLSI